MTTTTAEKQTRIDELWGREYELSSSEDYSDELELVNLVFEGYAPSSGSLQMFFFHVMERIEAIREDVWYYICDDLDEDSPEYLSMLLAKAKEFVLEGRRGEAYWTVVAIQRVWSSPNKLHRQVEYKDRDWSNYPFEEEIQLKKSLVPHELIRPT